MGWGNMLDILRKIRRFWHMFLGLALRVSEVERAIAAAPNVDFTLDPKRLEEAGKGLRDFIAESPELETPEPEPEPEETDPLVLAVKAQAEE